MKPTVKGRVSIIVPVYNTRREYLRECFDSVMEQDYEDIELIVVNDGSTEPETNRFCGDYAKEHRDKCLLLEKANGGASAARGEGLMEASGSMVMFVDSDDTLMSKAVARLVRVMEEQSADAVVGQDNVRTEIPSQQVLEGKEILRALLENKEASFGWALWGKIFDTALMRHYYRPRRDIFYGEDLLVNAEYFANAGRVTVLNEKVYCYRADNPESAMKQARSVKKLTLIRMWKEMADIYRVHAMEDEVVKTMANYYDSLLSGYLQCEYYRYENYKGIMKSIKNELKDNMKDIFSNPYVKGKLRYPAAVYCLFLFRVKRFLKDGGRA